MTRYIAIIDYDEAEDVFGAFFPDAPGCAAMGRNEEEVIANATDALSEWVSDIVADGRGAPQPRSYVALLKSNEYPQLGKGGMIASIPLIFETGKSLRANVSMDAGLLRSIDEEAARIGLTRSAFLASAAREKIRNSV